MTFAPAGSPFSATAKTFSLTPAGVGNLILCEVISETAADYATVLSSSNVTWSVLVAHTPLSANSVVSTVFIGEVTAASAATVTVTTNIGSPTLRIMGQEFSTTAGFSAVTLDASGTVNAATTLFPSLTPGHGSGELYWGYAFWATGATNGSTSGYTYAQDANSNGMAYDASCANSAQQPAWGASATISGIAVLLYEAATSVTATASLTVTPSLAAAREHDATATASLTVTPSLAAAAAGAGTGFITGEDSTSLLYEDDSPVLDETVSGALTATASLTVTPSLAAAREHAATAAASLAVTPSLAAAAAASHAAAASLAVTPSLTAGAGQPHTATASLTVTPSLTAKPRLPFPSAPLDLRCEIDAGGWTDTTSDVYQRDGTSPPVTLTRGRADESTQANPGTAAWEWNNRSGKYSPKNPLSPLYGLLGRNTPVRWSVPAQSSYLRSETDTDSGAACGDAAGLHITGDIDIRLDLHLTDYGDHNLMYRWGSSGNQSWFLRLAGGLVQFFWSTTGSDFPAASSTAPLPIGRLTLRVTLAVATGTVTFYTGPAGNADASSGWTQLGAAVVTGATSVFAGTAGGTVSDFYGSVYEAEVRSGIAGTVKAHPVFSAQPAGTTSFTDAQSNTWVLTGTAEISARSYRWHGQMSAQPPKWDVTGRDMAVAATAGGLLRLISQGQAPLMSPLKRAFTLLSGATAPVAYWPMEDAAGATVLGSAVGGQPMTVSGSPDLSSNSDFACSAALPVTKGASFTGTVRYAGGWTDSQAAFLLEIPAAGEADQAVIAAVTTRGTVQTLTLRYRTAGSGSLELYGYDSSGTQLFDSTVITGFALNGTPVMASVALQDAGGGDITWHCDVFGAAGGVTGLSGTVSGTAGAVTRVALNRDGTLTETVLGHCAVLTEYQQLNALFAYTAPNGVLTGALNAWAGEPAAVRFARLAAENGYASRIIGAPAAASAAMGAQAIDTLGNLLQACEDADRGQIFEPRQALAIGYRTLASMYSQSPALTLDYSASEPGGADGNPDDSGLDPTYDDLLSRNDWTLTRSAGTGADGATYQYQLNDGSPMSITGIGDYADTLSVNVQYDSQLPDLAAWMVHVGTVDEARWPSLPLNLARAQTAPVYWDALAADIGDLIEMDDAPDLVTYDPVRQLAFQVTEKLGGFWYEMEYNAVPASPYDVFEASGSARIQTAGSTLAGAYAYGDATMSVASSGSRPWTTAAGDFPFDIMIDGMRVTVTDIAGAGTPQVFSVTPGVNGVQKNLPAGAAVLAYPAVAVAL